MSRQTLLIAVAAIAIVLIGLMLMTPDQGRQAPVTGSNETRIEAPGATVNDDGTGTSVTAPGTNVETDESGTRVQAPGVDIQVPRKDDN